GHSGCSSSAMAGLRSDSIEIDPATGRPIAHPTSGRPAAGACCWVGRLAGGATVADVARTLPAAAVGRRFQRAIHGFAARLDDRQVAALRADPNVASVSPDWTA